MKAQRIFENIGFERGQIPQKTLRIGKYRTTPRTFKDYEGEKQTIEVDQENTFDLYDMKVKLVFKKKEGEEFSFNSSKCFSSFATGNPYEVNPGSECSPCLLNS